MTDAFVRLDRMTEDKPKSCRFGSFTFDTEHLILKSDGQPVPLKRQSASVLALLLENANSIVTRDQIKDHVWQSRTIEYDDGINACIRDIRRALGDRPPETRFIETLPKVGYRFLITPHAQGGLAVRSKWSARLAAVLALGAVAIAAFALMQVSDTIGPAESRVAVMPFVAPSGQTDATDAASLLTAQLVAAMAEQQNELRVISAGELFEDRDPGMGDVSRWLEVDYIIAGQVSGTGDDMHINLRLVRTEGYVHLWSKTMPFEKPPTAAKLQTLIAEITAAAQTGS